MPRWGSSTSSSVQDLKLPWIVSIRVADDILLTGKCASVPQQIKVALSLPDDPPPQHPLRRPAATVEDAGGSVSPKRHHHHHHHHHNNANQQSDSDEITPFVTPKEPQSLNPAYVALMPRIIPDADPPSGNLTKNVSNSISASPSIFVRSLQSQQPHANKGFKRFHFQQHDPHHHHHFQPPPPTHQESPPYSTKPPLSSPPQPHHYMTAFTKLRLPYLSLSHSPYTSGTVGALVGSFDTAEMLLSESIIPPSVDISLAANSKNHSKYPVLPNISQTTSSNDSPVGTSTQLPHRHKFHKQLRAPLKLSERPLLESFTPPDLSVAASNATIQMCRDNSSEATDTSSKIALPMQNSNPTRPSSAGESTVSSLLTSHAIPPPQPSIPPPQETINTFDKKYSSAHKMRVGVIGPDPFHKAFPYIDATSTDAPLVFQQRLSELAIFQVETIRLEQSKFLRRRNKVRKTVAVEDEE